MTKLFISYSEEYEHGWGSRPDGVYIASDIDVFRKYIDEHGNHSGEYHTWSCGPIEEVWVEPSCPNAKNLMSEIDSNEHKVIQVDNLKNLKVDFFKKLT